MSIAFPHLSKRPRLWEKYRERMIVLQLPILHPILKNLREFLNDVNWRLSNPTKRNLYIQNSALATLEKSLIGFLEAQAYTRAFLHVEAGEESDVVNLYKWWRDFWSKVSFENLREIPDLHTFSEVLRRGWSPYEVLLTFLNMNLHHRHQDLCATWLVTLWMKDHAQIWIHRFNSKLESNKQMYAKQTKLVSEDLLRNLHGIGFPRVDTRH